MLYHVLSFLLARCNIFIIERWYKDAFAYWRPFTPSLWNLEEMFSSVLGRNCALCWLVYRVLTGESSSAEDGHPHANQHLPASRGRQNAESDLTGAQQPRRLETGHWRHNHHEREPQRCSGQYLRRPSARAMEEGMLITLTCIKYLPRILAQPFDDGYRTGGRPPLKWKSRVPIFTCLQNNSFPMKPPLVIANLPSSSILEHFRSVFYHRGVGTWRQIITPPNWKRKHKVPKHNRTPRVLWLTLSNA